MPPDNVRYEEEAPMKFLKSISLTAAIAAGSLFAAPTFARVAVGVSVGFPPRAERVVVGSGPAWMPGYWRWNGPRRVWVAGCWTYPRPGYRPVPAHWVRTAPAWHFRAGYWVR
jgi:hypothetical protein